jgi:16S rRNA (guanine966-N2)-methyltransferase
MRIIAGQLKGLSFASPHGHQTHPMSEKARGALFNTLGDISQLTVLDAFAGSGALAFEAVSRGAKSVIAIERDRLAQRTISENITHLNVEEQVRLIKTGANAWLQTSSDSFDLVLLDPPYDDLQPKLLAKLANRSKIGGLAVLSLPPKTQIDLSPTHEAVAAHDYGDAQLVFYRRIS